MGVAVLAAASLMASVVIMPVTGHAAPLPSVPPFVQQQMPDAVVVGTASYSYLFWDLYQATLYAPHGQWQPEQPFALELRYLTDLTARKIVAVSRDEMTRQGSADPARIAAWGQRLLEILPDVQKGSVLTGVHLPDGTTRFYAGDRDVGAVDDPAFASAFFGIWLAPNTRDPDLRARLLRQDAGQGRERE